MNAIATFALAWKELRQLLGITLAISVCAILGFAISAGLENWLPSENPLEFFYSIVPATLTPISIALAGAVIAVGGERQIGNWQWMTTLPVTWVHSLVVKLVVILFLATIAGAAVFGITWTLNLLSDSPLSYEIGTFEYDYRLMLFALPIALLWAIIMCLCIREPMIAIMVTAVVTLLQGFLKNLLLSEFVSSSAPTDFGIMALTTTMETLVLLIFAALSFRAGWFNSEPILASALSPSVAADSLTGKTRWGTWGKPYRFTAMLWQSLQPQIWPIGILAVVTLGATLLFGIDDDVIFPIVVFLLPAVLGLFTLSSEQTRKQYRVIADRGISPTKYLLVRTLIPLFLITCASLIVLPSLQVLMRFPREFRLEQCLTLWAVSLCIYFSFVLANIAFANPLLALFVGVGTAVAMSFALSSPVMAGGYKGLAVAIPLSILALSLPWLLARRWMRLDNNHVPWISLLSLLAIGLASLSFYAPLRAYSVPQITLPPFNPNALGQNSASLFINTRHREDADYIAVEKCLQALRDDGTLNSLLYEQLSPTGFRYDFQSLDGESLNADPNAAAPEKTFTDYVADIRTCLSSDAKSMRDDDSTTITSLYDRSASETANWLNAVICIAIHTKDKELLTEAIDLYAKIVDPRFPWVFSTLDRNAIFGLGSVLHHSGHNAPPEFCAIIFDRLSANTPNSEVWTNFFVGTATRDDSNNVPFQIRMFYSANRYNYFYENQDNSLWGAAEQKRFFRCKAIEAAYNIEQAIPLINELNAINNDNQTARGTANPIRKIEGATMWQQNWAYRITQGPATEAYTAMTDGNFGPNWLYYYPFNTVDNIRFYLLTLQNAAQGTNPAP